MQRYSSSCCGRENENDLQPNYYQQQYHLVGNKYSFQGHQFVLSACSRFSSPQVISSVCSSVYSQPLGLLFHSEFQTRTPHYAKMQFPLAVVTQSQLMRSPQSRFPKSELTHSTLTTHRCKCNANCTRSICMSNLLASVFDQDTYIFMGP